MHNAEIAAALDEIADLLEFQGANSFRVRAYRNAARTVHDLTEPLERVAVDPARKLTDFNGIGAELALKIQTLVSTGKLPMLEELRAAVPESVLALMRIPGLGPKKAAALFSQLGIKTLDELRSACELHRVRDLKGFGEKTEAAILAGMSFAASPEVQRIYWADADVIVQALVEYLKGAGGVRQIEPAGSYRRGRETVGDLDFVVDAENGAAVMDRLAAFPEVAAVLGRGDTKMSVRLLSGLQVDLRIVPKNSFGAALVYFTGSKQHNIVLRGLAKQRGLRINEYGVFRLPPGDKSAAAEKTDTDKVAIDDAGGDAAAKEIAAQEAAQLEYIAGRTEKEVYDTLDLAVFAPEMREARSEFAWAAAGPLPKLIELGDIRGDLHMHTTATDGKASLDEMIAAARDRGLKYIAITDHSKRVSMANGLDGDRLRAQWARIDEINRGSPGVRVLKGVEVDILERGGLDLPDDVLAEADWIVASVHYGQNQSSEQITERIIGAIENPHVSAIAHPTGRLIGRRKPYAVDIDAVFAAAKRCGKLMELNSNPARLDLDDLHCAAAKRHGIPIVISSDAHSTAGLQVLRYGILQARRAGLTKADVANTRPWPKLKALIGEKK
ncbi:MAG TPA: helix-hairpin-helix domain-containing protein [Pirellulales bacterium]|nr:helix-hairpin-helix domain-containing protein [Pirellulales bacterium]